MAKPFDSAYTPAERDAAMRRIEEDSLRLAREFGKMFPETVTKWYAVPPPPPQWHGERLPGEDRPRRSLLRDTLAFPGWLFLALGVGVIAAAIAARAVLNNL